MRNNDQTELGKTGGNLFVSDFCAPHVLAYTKKTPRSFLRKEKDSMDTQTLGPIVKSSLAQAQKLPSA